MARPKDVDPTDPKNLMRDTWILEGKATHAHRAKWDKAWNRAGKIGILGLVKIRENRDRKRGFEI